MLRTTLLHSGWEFAESRWTQPKYTIGTLEPTWLPAQVPGHVHLDLVEAGLIAHPFERMNEIGCQWVDERDWSYRTTFTFAPDVDLPRRKLRFEGLDTLATIFLNDVEIGRSENMFVPLEIDVTERLVPGENTLRVEFAAASPVGMARKDAYFAANGITVNNTWFTDRSFVRKAQYMYGWDWGPRLVSCGIWRPVSILEYAGRITDVHVTQHHHDDGSVQLTLKSTVEGDGVVYYSVFDPAGEYVTGFPGDASISIEEPQLWQPNGLGDPNLYTVIATLLTSAEDDAEELDQTVVEVGLRTARLLRETDAFGESFEFEVNGKRIWARGANWIPDHSFPSIITKTRLREQLERCLTMGFNMLRVWGGGLYETDEFYELCDALGILVWQDFPFACAYYPDDEPAQAVVAAEAAVNVKRLRNHPSLILWCGNNENHQMWHDKWGGPEQAPDRYYGFDLYEKVLPQVLAELDPSRSYIPSSAIGATTDEYGGNANRGGFGDQHNWDVWHGRGDWRYYTESTGRFSSEYGFASSCHTEVWEKTLADADWNPHSAAVQWHDKTTKGHETFHGFVQLHYPESITLEDWVYYSQLNQRDALRYGIEHYRRSEFCKGSLIWQVNDCWPVQSWAILDSDGNAKALGYELRRLYADAIVSIIRDGETVSVWAINDGSEAVAGPVDLTAHAIETGEILRAARSDDNRLEPGERRKVLEMSVSGLSNSETLLVATWLGDETWQLIGEPKATAFPDPAPLVVSTHDDGILRIKTDTPLVDLFLTDEGSVKPFLDNFVTIPEPGIFEIRTTRIPTELAARSLAGEHRVVVTRSPI